MSIAEKVRKIRHKQAPRDGGEETDALISLVSPTDDQHSDDDHHHHHSHAHHAHSEEPR